MARFVIGNDSKSLYNHSLAPGWTQEDCETLRILIRRFGVGKWAQIHQIGLLPGKNSQQLNLQTQRLLGQQSLREFMGLRIDTQKVFMENSKKQKDTVRKGGLIINQSDVLMEGDLKRRLEENRALYETNVLEQREFAPIAEELKLRSPSPFMFGGSSENRPLTKMEKRDVLLARISSLETEQDLLPFRREALRGLLSSDTEHALIIKADKELLENPISLETIRQLRREVGDPEKRPKRPGRRNRAGGLGGADGAWGGGRKRRRGAGDSDGDDDEVEPAREYGGRRTAGRKARSKLRDIASDFLDGEIADLLMLED